MAQTSLPRNDKELASYLTIPFYKVVDYLIDRVWRENRDVVRQVVYEAGKPNWYERTNQFKESWNTRNSTQKHHGNLVEKEFYYDWEKMAVDREKAQHGSPPYVDNYQDVRPYLADIIYQGLSGDLFGDGYWRKARDAWKHLVEAVGKKKVHKWIKEAFDMYGFDYERYANVALETWDD